MSLENRVSKLEQQVGVTQPESRVIAFQLVNGKTYPFADEPTEQWLVYQQQIQEPLAPGEIRFVCLDPKEEAKLRAKKATGQRKRKRK